MKYYENFLLVILAFIFDVLTIFQLYKWFVIPLGFPALTPIQLVGCVVFVGYFTKIRKDGYFSFREKILISLFKSIMFLSVGYVLNIFY